MTAFRGHARAEKKCAASPGGTFFILLPGPVLSTHAQSQWIRLNCAVTADSKGKLLVARREGLEILAGESLPIVASRSGSTTYRATERFLVHP
jgi:hypothetical protein